MRIKCRRGKVGGCLRSYPGGFPVQRGEGGDVVNRPGGELRQDVVEVFAQVDLEAFAGLHDREDGRNFSTGFRYGASFGGRGRADAWHSLCGDGDYAEVGASRLDFQRATG